MDVQRRRRGQSAIARLRRARGLRLRQPRPRLVRSPCSRRRPRRRSGPAGAPLRHGRERVARCAGLAGAVDAARLLSSRRWPSDARRSGRGGIARLVYFDPSDPVEDPHYDAGLGPHDQRAVESRGDVLVYSTPPLEDDLLVMGQIECRLWIASSAPDTDFSAGSSTSNRMAMRGTW